MLIGRDIQTALPGRLVPSYLVSVVVRKNTDLIVICFDICSILGDETDLNDFPIGVVVIESGEEGNG